MTKRTSSRIPRAAYLAFFLLSCTLNASAYQSRSIIGVTTQHATSASRVRRKPVRSELFQSQGVEEDFRVISAEEHQTNTSSKIRWLRQTWSRALRVDRKQVAELGMSFMLTYNLVSNINGSIFLSLAWYITSIRTGLSPIAAGQWKGLLGTYAGLYVFITLFRPLRLALAVALTKRVAVVLDQTQDRFNCSQAMAAGMILSAMLSFWLIFASCGITLASTLAGVPIWQGV